MKLSDIKPYPNNPRKNAKAIEPVVNSLEQYGWQQPIVVDRDHVIVVGHTRYQAAKKLGLTDAPVVVARDLTEEQCRSYRIMDNRSNENSRWDDDLLLQELQALIKNNDIQELSYETGFTESELNKMFSEKEADLEKYLVTQHSRSLPGDVWILGNHKIVNGSSVDPEMLKLLFDNEKIDLVWEDPPYGVSYQTPAGINRSKEENELRNHKIKNDNLTPEQLDQFLLAHMEAFDKYVKPGAPIYWCHDIRFNEQFKKILERFKYHIRHPYMEKEFAFHIYCRLR